MIVSQVIAAYLRMDYDTSASAASVRALNGSKYATDADVPVWMYQPLTSLLGVSSGSGATGLDRRIVDTFGADEDVVPAHIKILEKPMPSDMGNFFLSNEDGAQVAEIQIAFFQPKVVSDVYLLPKLERRVRLLLDANSRSLCRKTQNLPDSAVAATNFLTGYTYNPICKFIGYMGEPNVHEMVVNYQVEYVESFGRASLP